MMHTRKGNFSFKSGDYCFSHVKAADKKWASFPWIVSYILDKLKDISLVKTARYLYHKEAPFFMLVMWTVLTATVFILISVSKFTSITANALLFLIPCFICFFAYLWTGLFLKYYMLPFSLGICLVGCLTLEVIIELLILVGLCEFSRPVGTISITLSFILIPVGIYMTKDSSVTTWLLLTTFIISRYTIVDALDIFQWRVALPPFLTYVSIIGGLAVSSFTNLKIPNHIGSEMDFKTVSEIESIPVIRQRRASSVEIPVLNQNGISNMAGKTRRKSLPVLGLPTRKFSMSSMDLTILGEAHGMITDLLADSSLPVNVAGTLRIVADMIAPLLQHSFSKQTFSSALLTVLEKTQFQEDEQQVMNQPDLKDDTPLSLRQRLQRNLGVSSRRMSSSYTTTTSATGMPTIDMEYHAKKNVTPVISKSDFAKRVSGSRSRSYAGILSDRKLFANNKSHSFSQASFGLSLRNDFKTQNDEGLTRMEANKKNNVSFMESFDGESEDVAVSDEKENEIVSCEESHSKPENNTGETNRPVLSSVIYDKSDCKLEDLSADTDFTSKSKGKCNEEDITIVDNEKLSESVEKTDYSKTPLSVGNSSNEKLSDTSQITTSPLKQQHADTIAVQSSSPCKRNQGEDPNLPIPVNCGKRKTSRELHLDYEIAVSHKVDKILNRITEWDFPIFQLNDECNVLTQLAFRIFNLCDFFKKFKISESTFIKYYRALENGYHSIPYHNRIHAADVLHGVYYLTQQKIPGFNESFSRRSSLVANTDIVEEGCSSAEEYNYGCMADVIPDLELMALYTAAAMHDYDHPGRTNAFMVATLNPKALLYNDRSVLESHHAAASWSLLVTNPCMNFLSELDPVDFKRFRFIVIEEILSTDLKKHFDFLTEWNAKVSDQGGGLNFSCESDRILVGQMIIKLADISGPSKEWSLHSRWTDRIVEEFYLQGEDERGLGMPLSAYMDRYNPKVPLLQASFIKHLVSPLYAAYEKANTMPGEWIDGEPDEDEEETEIENENNPSDGESGEEEKTFAGKKKIAYSLICDNINKNHKRWLDIIEKTEKISADRLSESEDENV